MEINITFKTLALLCSVALEHIFRSPVRKVLIWKQIDCFPVARWRWFPKGEVRSETTTFCVAFILANLSMLELVAFLDTTLCSSAVVRTSIDLWQCGQGDLEQQPVLDLSEIWFLLVFELVLKFMVFQHPQTFPLYLLSQSDIYKIDDISLPVATLKTDRFPSLTVPLVRDSV